MKHFDVHGDSIDVMGTVNSDGIDVALVDRNTPFEPYVVAWGYNGDGTWCQGHYFGTLESAVSYMYKNYIN